MAGHDWGGRRRRLSPQGRVAPRPRDVQDAHGPEPLPLDPALGPDGLQQRDDARGVQVPDGCVYAWGHVHMWVGTKGNKHVFRKIKK